MHHPELTSAQRKLVGGIAAGAALIAAIGFVGSYTAVSKRAHAEGLGWFADVFPLGVDAGIVVLLALDLLLAWLRMPLPLLRHTGWLLTAATIAFNAAVAWPDPLGVGMHAVIPVLFVVTVEAARHAVGRLADITADRHIEPVRLTRWLLSPCRTFVLWRRMKLWEMRSYSEVIRFEQERLVYRARLQAEYGRGWRRKAPVEVLLPLRLMRYGRPLDEPGGAPLVFTTEFERAADEAIALAPSPAELAPTPAPAPAPAGLVLDLAPMHPPIPELTAHEPVLTLAARGPKPTRVHARITDPAPDAEPECVEPAPATHSNPAPEPEVHPNPARAPEPHPHLDPELAELVRRGRELAKSGRLTLARAKTELRIGQSKAQQVIAVVHPKRS
ncbi:DUF2637 domain-containing protein [Streptomyces sp. NPDC013171]|uniref:DUF2637 domain-containing protein n=1 Tax=Streptomyces sp. NPDC013171 TaxID=3364863 RepID=UPI0036949FBE